MKRIFFILEGNNGATYIFNVEDADTITFSLRFYKARTIKQKVMKNTLKLYLNSLSLLCRNFGLRILKDKDEIQKYLEKLIGHPIDSELDENSSILVSSTQDKIIVHHHGHYFHKFAFGDSYNKVKNEVKIYELLDQPLQNFKVSKFYDHVDSENEFCSFKLISERKNVKIDIDITTALIEMFDVAKQSECLFTSYLEDLKSRCIKSNVVCNSMEKMLDQLDDTHKNELILLGLVHRDFKPWNINDESRLLIYDFEEAVIGGPPLEDLFNYHIDPIVRYLTPSKVTGEIFKIKNVKEYKRYLENLEINLNFEVLLYCFLMERAVFWMDANEKEASARYCDLFEYIVIECKEK
jgi:hypothetical protein